MALIGGSDYSLVMTLSNGAIVALAIAPNAMYVIGLVGLMAARTVSGLAPLPNGATPLVMGLSAVIPLASVAVANLLRHRRST
jgi:hypothetical protein